MSQNDAAAGDEDKTAALLIAIIDDVRQAEKELRRDDSQFRRRTYVRATFSSVEGLAYAMKTIALGKPDVFTAGETAVLREEEYVLTPKGEIRARRRSLHAAENLRFAFASFMRFHGSTETLPDGDAWRDFMRAVEIRNRVTHPKGLEDLEISDEDVRTVRGAAHWLAMNVLMSVVKPMGPVAVALLLAFLIGWGLARGPADPSQVVAVPQPRETD